MFVICGAHLLLPLVCFLILSQWLVDLSILWTLWSVKMLWKPSLSPFPYPVPTPHSRPNSLKSRFVHCCVFMAVRHSGVHCLSHSYKHTYLFSINKPLWTVIHELLGINYLHPLRISRWLPWEIRENVFIKWAKHNLSVSTLDDFLNYYYFGRERGKVKSRQPHKKVHLSGGKKRCSLKK